MSESIVYDFFACNKFCRVCLLTTHDLFPMSDEHADLYRNIIEKASTTAYEMKTCTNCLWMLRKFHKFKNQCQSANNLLKELVFMDSKNFKFMQNLTSSYHLTKSRIEVNDYRPLIFSNTSHHDKQQNCTNNYDDSLVNVTNNYHNNSESFTDDYHNDSERFTDDYQNESEIFTDAQNKTNYCHDKFVNVTVGYHSKSEHFTDDYQKESVNVTTEYDNKSFNVTNDYNSKDNDKLVIVTENSDIIDRLIYSSYNNVILDEDITEKNDKFDDITINNDTFENDMHENDDSDNNDEKPLMLLRKDIIKDKKKKKKKKIKNDEIKQNSMPTEEANKQEKTESEAKPKKTKKVLRNGFTSRMVQETNEYTVIKLTKEQVLAEMAERAKTDSYIRSPFKCQQCIKAFNFDDVLQTHLEKHSMKNGSFECEMCHQYCPSAVSLRGHIKSHTTRYKCKVCGRVRISRQHLLEHYAAHTGAAPAYTCDRCQFTSDKRTVMQRHVRSHRNREPLPCHACGKLFKSVESLRLHTAGHDKSSRFKCDRCEMSFVYHSLLRRHIQCVHESREFYCVECDLQFKSSENLRLHFKKALKHRDPSVYKHECTECNAFFASPATLSTHRCAAHSAPRTHACSLCPRMYSTRDGVRAHTWRAHAPTDARVSCAHCGNSYARKSTLKRHLLTHTGARAHTCECGAAFAQRKSLQAHKAKHKKEELQQYETKVEV